ncbi:hypothetical protein [Octadecabacter antarcticus]|uniref:hypothetical protein n=1 Tax=Octadecabacter antarcticus TaxID=1217908 RepID=UPI001FE02763|nr:hypothetical protein [Octadecabacter antarcticus]
MKRLVSMLWASLCFMAAPAAADLLCLLTDVNCLSDCAETSVHFSINTSQFVDAQDPNDPPRRQVSDVAIGDRRFTAQAIMMDGGIVGFHEDAGELGSALMIVQASGAARLTLQPQNITLRGMCTE